MRATLLLITVWMVIGRAMAQSEVDGYTTYFEDSENYLYSTLGYSSRGLPWLWREVSREGVTLNSLSDDRVPYSALGMAYRISTFREYGLLAENYELYLPSSSGGYGSIALSSRTYTYRAEAGYNYTSDNFSARLSAAKRWGRSLTTEGVFSDSYNISLGVEAKNFSVIALVNPTERSYSRATTREAYSLAENNLYNPSWGYQNSVERSVNVRKSIEPTIVATHFAPLSKNYSLESALAVRFGRNSYSALSWQGSPNPNPDYYAYMPSQQSSQSAAEAITEAWREDEDVRQINFSSLYAINSDDPRANYIIEERVTEPLFLSAQSFLRGKNFSVGLRAAFQSERHYKELNSLLGADYWLDIDCFVEQDSDVKDLTQNNMADPNREVKVGDIFGYNYRINNLEAAVDGSYRYERGKWGVFASGSIGIITTQRIGYWEKENFAGGASLGASEGILGVEGEVEAEVSYSVNRNFRVSATGLLKSFAPNSEVLFINEEYRNAVHSGLSNSWLAALSGSVSYLGENFRAEGSLYYYGESGGALTRDMYDDMASEYVNYLVEGISTVRVGVEVSAEVRLWEDLWLSGAVVAQSNTYSENPSGTSYKDSTGEQLISSEEINYKGKHVGGSPERVSSLTLSYEPYGWNVSLSGVFSGGLYEVLSPLRYTSRIVDYSPSAESYSSMVAQECYASAFTLNLSGGYTFRFSSGDALTLYGSLTNILGSDDIVRYGYQSDRFYTSSDYLTAQSSRLYYALPLTFSLSATFRF